MHIRLSAVGPRKKSAKRTQMPQHIAKKTPRWIWDCGACESQQSLQNVVIRMLQINALQ